MTPDPITVEVGADLSGVLRAADVVRIGTEALTLREQLAELGERYAELAARKRRIEDELTNVDHELLELDRARQDLRSRAIDTVLGAPGPVVTGEASTPDAVPVDGPVADKLRSTLDGLGVDTTPGRAAAGAGGTGQAFGVAGGHGIRAEVLR